MFNDVWPLALVVASNVAYQICAKSVPGGMNPFASLTITYSEKHRSARKRALPRAAAFQKTPAFFEVKNPLHTAVRRIFPSQPLSCASASRCSSACVTSGTFTSTRSGCATCTPTA